VAQAPTGAPDVVGAFRFLCGPSHYAYADPIVFPGDKTGKAHLHMFFGNTQTNEDSTYDSLRKAGDSTCISAGNRSAYWQPAMIQTRLDGAEELVDPSYLNIYYKRRPASDPWFKANGVIPVNMPRGLRFVFGFPTVAASSKCVNTSNWSNVTDWSTDMEATLAKCLPGHDLDIAVATPPCWDGKNLDSPDHRSHMAYERGGAEHGYVTKCPSTHPYMITQFTLQANFRILSTDRPSTWRLSSDSMMNPGGKRGSTFHADWFGAWEDGILEAWQANCINKLLSCNSGNLGNGTGLVENAASRATRFANLRRPVPAGT
jgi:hypothetical protein